MISSEHRAAALAALSEWQSQRRWARKDPASLSLKEVRPVGPVQLELVSVYEARGVTYDIRPATSRPERPDTGPSPWNVEITILPEAPVGRQVEVPLSKQTVHMDCGVCSSTGVVFCPACGGDGSVSRGKRTEVCAQCGGRGQLQCSQCEGSGGVVGTPTVWARIEEQTVRRVLDTDDLPTEVYLALQEHDHGGVLIHEQKSERIEDLAGHGGYRDAADSRDPVCQLVRTTCAELELPHNARLRHQRLQLRRVPAWEVVLEGGESLWVYGAPPHVSPPRALRSRGLRVAEVLPGAAFLVLVAYALLAWLAD